VNGLFQQAARLWAAWPMPAGSAVMVLGYHRVNGDPSAADLAVLPETFAAQAAHLAERRDALPVLDLHDALDALDALDQRGTRRAVVLTFDDAWADNHAHALGPLVEHGLPATLYVPSALLGTGEYMSRDQVVEMAGSGVTIGAHSRSHVDLRTCSDDELVAEVRGSRDDLEDLLGRPVTSFAYPAGLMNDKVRGAVVAAGFRTAVSTVRGWTRAGSDRFTIPRNFIEEFGLATFDAAARGGLNVVGAVDRVKARLRR
jgi:peptidoglycan/xylan/chitin deacetylase (PgdA/CDA1 family)